MPVRSRKKRSDKEEEKDSEDTNQFSHLLTHAMEQLGINVDEVSHLLNDKKFNQILQSMTENLKENFDDLGSNPYVYGFKIGVDEEGKPDFSEFGDIRTKMPSNQEEKVVRDEAREPLTEIFKEEKQVRIVTEIPGVDTRNISIRGEEGKIIIEALGVKNYTKEIQMTEEVDMEKGTASYRNGILEVLVPRGTSTITNSVEIIITD